MEEQVLKAKMDELGQLMFELEQAQLQFDYEQRERTDRIDTLKRELKEVILSSKESAESYKLRAVYQKGVVTWKTDRLDSYCAKYPELLKFRKEGAPTVAFLLKEEY